MVQKTQPNSGDVDAFIAAIEDDAKRADSHALVAMMQDISGHQAVLWGNMIGFGQYHYKYASGHEGDSFLIGFAPRKAEFSLYILATDEGAEAERQADQLGRLGKHRAGKGCLYVKRLADIDTDILRELSTLAFGRMSQRYPQ